MSLSVRCRSCGKELHGIQNKTVACGCSNMVTISGETVSAVDMAEVVLTNSNNSVKKQPLLSENDLQYQEARRKRKVRKLTFEER